MRGGRFLAAALLTMSVVAAPARADDGAARLHLGEPELRVLYRDSGRLSGDLVHGDGPRASWNLTIGEGGLDGPADDAMVVLPIRADKDRAGNGEVFSNAPIMIRARGSRGRIVAQRIAKGVLTSAGGQAYLALWLPDVTCNGPLTIEATMGKQRVAGRFDFNCGE